MPCWVTEPAALAGAAGRLGAQSEQADAWRWGKSSHLSRLVLPVASAAPLPAGR